jgi:ArsR family transcriptional regulator, arsenate/arsenite/antimonite-responsive transcriptional repressor
VTASTATSLARAARVFHALSDETRLALVVLLRDGERCVCELTDALQAAQSRLSFHLKVLKEAGLISDRREGRWSYYALVPGATDGLEELIGELSPTSAVRAVRARCC